MHTATNGLKVKLIRLLSALMLCLSVTSGTVFAKVKVVATLPDLGALAKSVGGEHVDVTVLATASEDPHYVSPRPSFLVALSKADLLIHNGLDLELGWLPTLLVSARNPKIQTGGAGNVDASRAISKLLGEHAGKVDRAQGDIHPGGNPHFLMSAEGLADVSRLIERNLIVAEPAHKAVFEARGKALREALQTLSVTTKARFAALPPQQKRVVVYHDSLAYLVAWLGLEQVATIENKPGIKPSAAHMGAVLKQMREQGAKVILQEEWHDVSVSQRLSGLASAAIVRVPGGIKQGHDVVAHLKALTEQVYAALSR